MATYSSAATLTTPWGAITFNDATGDTYLNDPQSCSGLDMVAVRSTVDDKPQTDGGIVHSNFLGARQVTLGGTLIVRSSGTEAGTLSARYTLETNLTAALKSILRADGTYAWTDGGSTRTITVRCDQAVTYSGVWLKSYIFGLVAADPAIS